VKIACDTIVLIVRMVVGTAFFFLFPVCLYTHTIHNKGSSIRWGVQCL